MNSAVHDVGCMPDKLLNYKGDEVVRPGLLGPRG